MKMLKFPELRQTYEWDCGANAIQSVLVYHGIQLSEEVVIKQAKTTRSGTPIAGIKRAAKNTVCRSKPAR
jgi:ABC-type bacteriocin/lantibiotic exporter with double-glycine peptidase domain